MYNSFKFYEPIVLPGASERIQEMLKDIPEINANRPCTECAHYYHFRMIRCALSSGHCDFHHSGFKQISKMSKMRRNEKWEDTGYNQS